MGIGDVKNFQGIAECGVVEERGKRRDAEIAALPLEGGKDYFDLV